MPSPCAERWRALAGRQFVLTFLLQAILSDSRLVAEPIQGTFQRLQSLPFRKPKLLPGLNLRVHLGQQLTLAPDGDAEALQETVIIHEAQRVRATLSSAAGVVLAILLELGQALLGELVPTQRPGHRSRSAFLVSRCNSDQLAHTLDFSIHEGSSATSRPDTAGSGALRSSLSASWLSRSATRSSADCCKNFTTDGQRAMASSTRGSEPGR